MLQKVKEKNIIKIFPTPKLAAGDVGTERDVFLQIVDICMIDEIVNCTYLYIGYKNNLLNMKGIVMFIMLRK